MNTSRHLPVLVSVFFFWGFVAASNDILMPVLKDELHLKQWQSQLVSFAFYISYTVGSLIYLLIGMVRKKDLLESIGYRNGISYGLILSALGTLLFVPAAETLSLELFLTGLFVVGLGFSLQQTAANPLAINMGDPEKGSQRLSLAGGVNNIGTTIGPVIISLVLFGSVAAGQKADINNLKYPYLVLGAAFILVALLFRLSSVPNHPGKKAEVADKPLPGKPAKSLLEYPQLWLGMIAIFLYVGVEVASAGNLSELLKQEFNVSSSQASVYVSLYWASLMIGRWTSAAAAFGLNKKLTRLLGVVLPYAAFGLFLGVNAIAHHDIEPFLAYAGVIVLVIAGDRISGGNPARQLVIYGSMGIAALVTGMFTEGTVSLYAFMSVGLFCATLWPCIFTLSIAGLGERTGQASGLLVMMIMGGGFISVLQGWLADDQLLGVRYSYVIGVVCFAYLAFFGVAAARTLKRQQVPF
jgi:FHS family L-fucose permease-like MFS transporter